MRGGKDFVSTTGSRECSSDPVGGCRDPDVGDATQLNCSSTPADTCEVNCTVGNTCCVLVPWYEKDQPCPDGCVYIPPEGEASDSNPGTCGSDLADDQQPLERIDEALEPCDSLEIGSADPIEIPRQLTQYGRSICSSASMNATFDDGTDETHFTCLLSREARQQAVAAFEAQESSAIHHPCPSEPVCGAYEDEGGVTHIYDARDGTASDWQYTGSEGIEHEGFRRICCAEHPHECSSYTQRDQCQAITITDHLGGEKRVCDWKPSLEESIGDWVGMDIDPADGECIKHQEITSPASVACAQDKKDRDAVSWLFLAVSVFFVLVLFFSGSIIFDESTKNRWVVVLTPVLLVTSGVVVAALLSPVSHLWD